MDKDKLKKLAESRQFIPGIYNYCDRWCERCPQTSRCLVFALSEEHLADPEVQDVRNHRFWETLRDILHVTKELLEEAAGREGIALDSLESDTGDMDHALEGQLTERHDLCRMASDYARMVSDWFDSTDQLPESGGSAGLLDPTHGAVSAHRVDRPVSWTDALEVIRWYQHQIYVKIRRALQGTLEEEQESLYETPTDRDCSAKVALIGIDRSIAAWTEVWRRTGSSEGQILNLLVHLDRLRQMVETVFPGARSTPRPGFDGLD